MDKRIHLTASSFDHGGKLGQEHSTEYGSIRPTYVRAMYQDKHPDPISACSDAWCILHQHTEEKFEGTRAIYSIHSAIYSTGQVYQTNMWSSRSSASQRIEKVTSEIFAGYTSK